MRKRMNLFLKLITFIKMVNMNRQQRRKLERERKKSQRGSLYNHKNFKRTGGPQYIKFSEIYNPLLDLQNKGIQMKYEIPNVNSLRMKNFKKRLTQYPPLDGQDGLNCFGFPMVDLGNVDKDIVDSVENSSDPITFDQLEKLISPRMETPNGTLFPWGQCIREDYLEKLVHEDPEIVNRPVNVRHRFLTNSHVITLTEELGFTDEVWSDPVCMENYMTWCVRMGLSIGGEEFLMVDTPVDTYREVLMIPENITLN
tara:strand:+ start:1268 stop:2032 length:765 start_codon:yes stop_codon:yes gene_type:complete